jgi:hypothetical protein
MMMTTATRAKRISKIRDSALSRPSAPVPLPFYATMT